MKKIKFLIFLLALSSCNQYLGTVDPDYTPTNEVTEIFTDLDKNNLRLDVEFGDIIFPKADNPSLNINTLEIEKITNINKNSIVNFLNEKTVVSQDKSVFLFDKNNQDKLEYKLNLSKYEKIISIFEFNEDIHLITSRSRIFVINSQNILELADYDIFINIAPIVLDKNLLLFNFFG